jgi:hypothetical protein
VERCVGSSAPRRFWAPAKDLARCGLLGHEDKRRRLFGNPGFPTRCDALGSRALRQGRDGRAVEGARLESVYTPKGYRGFESHSLRHLRGEFSALRIAVKALERTGQFTRAHTYRKTRQLERGIVAAYSAIRAGQSG